VWENRLFLSKSRLRLWSLLLLHQGPTTTFDHTRPNPTREPLLILCNHINVWHIINELVWRLTYMENETRSGPN
jgi:hypothetical protein